uniref:Heme chaperone HemW n=1 Tax=Cyanothece sp. (strain PCC 7425 / ATCC 29141) TaxID=395961 RepID=B8HPM5_CYAP4
MLPSSPPDLPTAAYIHIPFCRRRCFYCDFPISVVGDRSRGETPAINHYIEVLCQEIQLAPVPPQPLATVFFGGGTPSLLDAAQIGHILQTVQDHLGIAASAEISLEVDPGTFTLAQMSGYRDRGVNRLSLGVQAFQPELLSQMGRTHTVAEIHAAVEMIRQAGLTNFGLDLISGLPGQTLEQWETSLQCAIDLQPTHVSTYDLVLEPGTVFGKRYSPGHTPLPEDEISAQMYELATERLRSAGYEHYEISNYAQPGYQCRHNRIYWQNRPYYGFGMGATSYVNHQRVSRPRTRREYYQWVDALAAAEGQMVEPPVTPLDEWLETLMMGLRLAEGVSLEALAAKFGEQKVSQLLKALAGCLDNARAGQQGWVGLNPSTQHLYLTDPEGFLFCNQVLLKIWQAFEAE